MNIFKVLIGYLLVLDRGSLGPSTVTLIALLYVVTCGGLVDTSMVNVKLLPETNEKWEQLERLPNRQQATETQQ